MNSHLELIEDSNLETGPTALKDSVMRFVCSYLCLSDLMTYPIPVCLCKSAQIKYMLLSVITYLQVKVNQSLKIV